MDAYKEGRNGWISGSAGLCVERAAWFQEIERRPKARAAVITGMM